LGTAGGLEVCCVAVKLSQEEEKKKRSRGVGAPELHVIKQVITLYGVRTRYSVLRTRIPYMFFTCLGVECALADYWMYYVLRIALSPELFARNSEPNPVLVGTSREDLDPQPR
jgi:hypothetical protein